MADVQVTYASLETAASQINAAKGDLDQVIQTLSNAINALEGQNAGVAYEALKNAWFESKPTMERLSQAVGNYSPEIQRWVQNVQSEQSSSASKLSGLTF